MHISKKLTGFIEYWPAGWKKKMIIVKCRKIDRVSNIIKANDDSGDAASDLFLLFHLCSSRIAFTCGWIHNSYWISRSQ